MGALPSTRGTKSRRRTKPNDGSIGGASSGAICAWTAAWERPDRFRRVYSSIGTYVGLDPSFDSEQAAMDYLASISAGFGPHTPEQWHALSSPLLREREGRWYLHYDPAIAVPFRALVGLAEEQGQAAAAASESALWALYDSLSLPTLLLRGAESDLLTAETAQAMTQRGPHALRVDFAGVGHAPTLVAADQIAAVRDFLAAA